jgi:RHS repeat-associated protein
MAGMAGFAFLLFGIPFLQAGRGKRKDGLYDFQDAFHTHPRRLLVLLAVLAAIICSAAAPEFSPQTSLALSASEKCYYYHSNHLGSINVVTDEKGKVVERREYKPYGEPFEWSGPNSGPRDFLQTFDGQYYDNASGLYYFGARHYDPQLGRFLAADTQIPDPNNPKDLHRYAFAGDNPVRYVDPTGHDLGFWDWVIGGLMVVGLVVLGILTCGIALGMLAGLGTLLGSITLTIGLAAVGAGVAGAYSLSQGASPLSGTDFWLSVAAGAAIGAAVGALLTLIPLAAGVHGVLFAGAPAFFTKLVAGILAAALYGGMERVCQHLTEGGSPAAIFSREIGLEVVTSILKGAIKKAVDSLSNWLAANAPTVYATIASYIPSLFPKLIPIILIWYNDPNWFNNSPSKPLGIPAWAFAGVGTSSSRDQSHGLAIQLQTMPLAP